MVCYQLKTSLIVFWLSSVKSGIKETLQSTHLVAPHFINRNLYHNALSSRLLSSKKKVCLSYVL